MKNSLYTGILFCGISLAGFSQTGQINIQQNEILPELLKEKSQLTKDGKLGERYMIQLYNGDNNDASEVIKKYRSKYSDWPSQITYESPNYKVLIGNFRNRLEADRALLQIKEDFPSAFIPKPRRS